MAAKSYDLIVAGTGFASAFFLKEYLQHAPKNAKVLWVERGRNDPIQWQVENRRNSSTRHQDTFTNRSSKEWQFNIGLGGGSNCWWACTPRLLPADFELKTRHGIGRDWPISYSDLEPFYAEVEEIMSISGDSADTPFPRSTPYPQPPHRFSSVDRALKKLHPDSFFHQPTARARKGTDTRPPCCATGVCHRCPIQAKFTILAGMDEVVHDPRVEIATETTLLDLIIPAGHATACRLKTGDQIREVKGEAFALGTNAVFNAAILLRSGLTHPLLGSGIHEQVSRFVDVDLTDIDNFDGSTSVTGHSYLAYDGDHRKERSACLMETWNVPQLRPEHGKWRKRLRVKCIFEDHPSPDNRVSLNSADLEKPIVTYSTHSEHAQRGLSASKEIVERLVKGLNVDRIHVHPEPEPTEAHILGTVPCSNSPSDGVVDSSLVHHKIRNLWVLGGSAFPASSPANPTLTLSALSLRAGRKAFA